MYDEKLANGDSLDLAIIQGNIRSFRRHVKENRELVHNNKGGGQAPPSASGQGGNAAGGRKRKRKNKKDKKLSVENVATVAGGEGKGEPSHMTK